MKCILTMEFASKDELLAYLTGSAPTVTIDGRTIANSPIVTTMSPNVPTMQPNMQQPHIPTPSNEAGDDDGPDNADAPATDANGVPWDTRIHSKTKGMNADGTWRRKRGVNDGVVAAVEAELKARHGATYAPQFVQPQPPQQPYTPPSNIPPMPNMTQPAPQQQYQPQPMQQQPAPYMANPGQMPVAPPPPPGYPELPPSLDRNNPNNYTQQPQMQQPAPQMQQAPMMDFQQFFTHLSAQMQKRDVNGQPLINVDYLANVVQRVSQSMNVLFNSITDIQGNPAAIAKAVEVINADGRWQ